MKTGLAEGRKLQVAYRQLVAETELFLLFCLRSQESVIWSILLDTGERLFHSEQLFLLACYHLLNTNYLPCWSSSGKATRSEKLLVHFH